MSDEVALPVTVQAAPAPNGGIVLALRLSDGAPLAIELSRDHAHDVLREVAAALGDGFSRTFTPEKARV